MDPKPKRQPVPAGGQPTPDAIAAADTTPLTETLPEGPQDSDSADDHAEEAERVEARVLVAFGAHDVNAIFSASADEVERQRLAGNVDPHADAVAYAKSLLAGA